MIQEFWYWWQYLPEQIDPVIFQIGSFRLQYYGLMYLAAFSVTYALLSYRVRQENRFADFQDHIEPLTTWMIVGVVLGGRLGYVVFYNLTYYLRHPLEIFLPFDFSNGITFTGISGMSYHGGLIGVMVGTLIYVRRYSINFWDIADLYAPAVSLGYTFGRIGNFINGELFGRITTAPFGMYFPKAPHGELRHPSQLYEAFFEGIFLFAVLWTLRKQVRTRGAMLALYLAGYGMVRFFIEFFREPDAHIGFVLMRFSAGQILCGFMMLSGVVLYLFLFKKQSVQHNT
jgi:phosphatidylglycerol:prolipoprotein diacylglycerol transferase